MDGRINFPHVRGRNDLSFLAWMGEWIILYLKKYKIEEPPTFSVHICVLVHFTRCRRGRCTSSREVHVFAGGARCSGRSLPFWAAAAFFHPHSSIFSRSQLFAYSSSSYVHRFFQHWAPQWSPVLAVFDNSYIAVTEVAFMVERSSRGLSVVFEGDCDPAMAVRQ